MNSRYKSKIVVMATQHDKGKLVAPHFNDILGMKLIEASVDTDSLGTFSGEIERTGTALETAIKKARMGIVSSNNPYGVASEGSVGPDPLFPFINANIETIVFVDDESQIEVHESYKSNEIIAFSTTTSKNDLDKFLLKTDFPNHALIVKPQNGVGAHKGIRDIEALRKAIKVAQSESLDGDAVIESDLRAMCSPSRQKNISIAAAKLAKRLSQACPNCETPGWGLKSYIRGVECIECGEVSHEAIKQEVLGCIRCEHTMLGAVINTTLDPARCMSCNP